MKNIILKHFADFAASVCACNRDIIGNTSHHIRILSVLLRSGRWGESLPDVLSSGWFFFAESVIVFIDLSHRRAGIKCTIFLPLGISRWIKEEVRFSGSVSVDGSAF